MAGWASLRQSIGRVYGTGYTEAPSKAGGGEGWSDLTVGTKGTSNDLGRESLAGAQGQDTVKQLEAL